MFKSYDHRCSSMLNGCSRLHSFPRFCFCCCCLRFQKLYFISNVYLSQTCTTTRPVFIAKLKLNRIFAWLYKTFLFGSVFGIMCAFCGGSRSKRLLIVCCARVLYILQCVYVIQCTLCVSIYMHIRKTLQTTICWLLLLLRRRQLLLLFSLPLPLLVRGGNMRAANNTDTQTNHLI